MVLINLQLILLSRLKAWARAISDAELEEGEEPIDELTPDNLKTAQDIMDYLSEVIYDRWYNGLISPQASLFRTEWRSAQQLTPPSETCSGRTQMSLCPRDLAGGHVPARRLAHQRPWGSQGALTSAVRKCAKYAGTLEKSANSGVCPAIVYKGAEPPTLQLQISFLILLTHLVKRHLTCLS